MKQSLSLNQRQLLKVSPQLQQAIRLLQLSSLELTQELHSACESNAMLEWNDDTNQTDEDVNFEEPLMDTSDGDNADEAFDEDGEEVESHNSTAELDSLSEALINDPGIDLSAIEGRSDIEWSETYAGEVVAASPNADILDLQTYRTTLSDHLMEQIELANLTEQQRLMAQFVVDFLDEDGYLRHSIQEISEDLSSLTGTDEQGLELGLKTIQSMNPPGVGARNLRECLRLQLREFKAASPVHELALQLVDECFDALTARNYEHMQRVTNADSDELDVAIELIRSLNPRPGASFCSIDASYVVPDVVVRKVKGEWVVDLNDDALPSVRINPLYKQCMDQMEAGSQKSLLQKQHREAKAILEGLKHRRLTLLKTAAAIVSEQQAFFEQGDSAMRPLLRSDIARTVGMHESTISRITTHKYLDSPRGIYELSYFFSSHVLTNQGNEVSSRAIKAIIRKLTSEENPGMPLSDSAIALHLRKQNIRIARRTVAKYRESLSIPASRLRQA